jgi:hypothetical protein
MVKSIDLFFFKKKGVILDKLSGFMLEPCLGIGFKIIELYGQLNYHFKLDK